MNRRFGAPKIAEQHYVYRPGAYAILTRGTSVLLTHQAAPFWEYQLPGGGIDPGESPTTALHREVFEETGWRIANVRRLGAFRRFTYMPDYDINAEKLCAIYHATPVRRLGPPSEEGHTAVWVDFDTAFEMLHNDGDRDMFQRFFL